MFRDSTADSLNEFQAWQAPAAAFAIARPRAVDAGFSFEDRTGELVPVYREIARRIAGQAFTRHASTLGDALR